MARPARDPDGHHPRWRRDPAADPAGGARQGSGSDPRGNLLDAELAERYGWINRTLPAEELDGFVDALAGRIAALRPEQIAAAKAAVGAASTGGGQLLEGLAEESKALAGVYPAPDAVVERMRAAVEAGAQTREGELDLEASLDRVPW
ncbi:hypothetical protein [Streptomyces sp. NBC_00162]|uniref:hypothetical protein n=1 Tax=Streptomyces sp. NBC_00162 TaxID=2903629 RepID=UPI002AFF869B|nr:hypothetical protein [Streptomyces sp. NBC_00162]